MTAGFHQTVVEPIRSDWMDSAACAGIDPERWFPEQGGDNGAEVKRLCARCPVQEACPAFALAREAGLPRDRRYGVWGGLGPLERYKASGGRLQLAFVTATHESAPPESGSGGAH